MQPPLHQNLSSLTEIEQQAWALLVYGSHKPGDAFYTGTLGTQSGHNVNLRMVVLREANPTEKLLICYSDNRASKVQDIYNNPAASFLFWDNERKIQLRLSGKAAIHTTDVLAEQHWQQASLSNRRSYLAVPAPGSSQPEPSSGLPQGLDSREPTKAESEKGRANFAVICIHIQHLDWLHLAKGGHRRAMFRYEEGKVVESNWLVP